MLEAPHSVVRPPAPDRAVLITPSPTLLIVGTLLLFAGVTAVLFLTDTILLYRYGLPLMALGMGYVLHRTAPVLYIGFVWWLWFLAAFMRRIIDYQAGWLDPNWVLLTPYLVGGVAVLTVLRHRAQLLRRDYFPFALALVGILYGYAIGMVKSGPVPATYDLLKWVIPLLLGLHITLNWEHYPAFRRCIQRTFIWGVVVMGLYAVVQFYFLPGWDAYWMIQSEMGSIGQPLPLKVRIFSTMTAPSPFAAVMMAGLLVLFSLPAWKHLAAAVPGYAGFLLSLVRSAWGGWLMALMLMAIWIKGRFRVRLLTVLVLGALVVIPALSVPAIQQRLDRRFETFENLEEDKSLNARLTLYRRATLLALTNPVGRGIGAAGTAQKVATGDTRVWDSGLLILTYQMGWPGLLVLLSSLGLLALSLWRIARRTEDPFVPTCAAIAFAVLALMLFKTSLLGASGSLFWCFAGLAIASERYHQAHYDAEEPLHEAEEAYAA